MLCDYCKDIDLDALLSPQGYAHHSSPDAIVSSAREGCALCGLIREILFRPSLWKDSQNMMKNSISEFLSPRIRVGDNLIDILIAVIDQGEQNTLFCSIYLV
jgi:hypothetical protein